MHPGILIGIMKIKDLIKQVFVNYIVREINEIKHLHVQITSEKSKHIHVVSL